MHGTVNALGGPLSRRQTRKRQCVYQLCLCAVRRRQWWTMRDTRAGLRRRSVAFSRVDRGVVVGGLLLLPLPIGHVQSYFARSYFYATWRFVRGGNCRQYLALKHEPTRDEVVEATEDISSWLASLKSSQSSAGAKPPASAAAATASGSGGVAKASAGGGKAAAAKADDDERPWTDAEKQFAATREKQKGNEAFHANELEKAVKHYTASLELVPGSAIVLANRCVWGEDRRLRATAVTRSVTLAVLCAVGRAGTIGALIQGTSTPKAEVV